MDRTVRDLSRDLADRIVSATIDRLNLMPAVAWFKYANDLQVRDRHQESRVLAQIVEQAGVVGIPTQVALPVVRAQFAAARQVQESLVARWTDQDRRKHPVTDWDLQDDLRPRIDQKTLSLLLAVADLNDEVQPDRWAGALQRAADVCDSDLSPDVPRQALSRALAPLTRAPGPLRSVA